MHVTTNRRRILAILCCFLGSCREKSDTEVELPKENKSTSCDQHAQVLFFEPNVKNENLFVNFQAFLNKNSIHMRGTSIDLGMVAFEVKKEDEVRLVELMRSNKDLFDAFRPLLDQQFLEKILER